MNMTSRSKSDSGGSARSIPRVVVGVDDSPGARAALRAAAQEAQWRAGELEVICCWVMPGGHNGHAKVPGPLREACLDEAQATLDRVVDEVLGGSPAVPVVRTVGEPTPEKTLVAASTTADLVVVGSHGRGGFTRLVLGSVSTQVVHHAHCPVLVVPPGNDVAGPPDSLAVDTQATPTVGTDAVGDPVRQTMHQPRRTP
ncbi:MAG TPA: universal stress protein [Acidimicrobiales bacterium]|nr:universal stress protein [Acidimicrobiales bacterium]